MPWSCAACAVDVAQDDLPCPSCGNAKAAWTVLAGNTRAMVVTRRSFECLRGAETRPVTGASEYEGASWRATEAVRAVSRAAAGELARAGQGPPPADLLTVRVTPRGKAAPVRIGVEYAQEALEEHEFEPDPELAAQERFDLRFLFVYDDGAGGPAPDELEGAFPGVRVVEISEGGGWAPTLEVTAVGKKGRSLRVQGGQGALVRLRLGIDPEAAGSRDDRFTLRSADGAYEQVKTVRDDRVPGDGYTDLEFTGVDPAGRYALEVDPGSDGPPYALFRDLSYDQLLALRPR